MKSRQAPWAALLPAVLAALPVLAAERPIALTVAAGQIDEICFEAKAGQAIHWRFNADAPVAFNLHHHVGQKVVMPVDLKDVRGHEGRHVAEVANHWCLMWTAPKNAPARIQGGFATDDIVR